MIKAPIGLQDPRRRIYAKAKAELSRRGRRRGFGWTRWSRQGLYEPLGLFNGYRVRSREPKASPA